MQILRKNNFNSWKIARTLKPKELIKKISNSGLRGRGGANFLTGKKWELSYPAEYLIVNGDESEPGRFKDKFILENNPELIIEGICIAMHATKAKTTYIYLREEYKEYKKALEKIIKKKTKENIFIIIGAGSYICGEETAILNSLEGVRPESRKKPPYPSEYGLFGKKTVINNLETIARIPLIFYENFDKDLLLFSISGDVEKPGVYELKEGIKLFELLSLVESYNSKAIFFGASGGCIKTDKNISLSYENISKMGGFFETGIIIVDKSKSIPDICRSIIQFFNEENCGKCVPCREGNFRLLQLFQVILKRKWKKEEFEIIKNLALHIQYGSQCALGESSTLHLQTALKYFKNEFDNLIS